MKLAVFTSRYPAQVATFFERDMRALLEAGVEIDIFSVAPLDTSLWKHSLALLGPDQLPRDRIHHLTLAESRAGLGKGLRDRIARRDAIAILASAARYGAIPFAKTAYVLPKAWMWAERFADAGYDHVLAYWGNYAGTCAYAFHRLATPHVPFSIWLHAGTDLYFRRVFLREKLLYADNIITCCEFNVQYIAQEFGDIAGQLTPKIHVSHHGLDLTTFPCDPSPAARPSNRVIAVGRLAHDKGYDDLLRAAHVAVGQGVDLVVELIGDGPEQKPLAALAAQLGLGDRVQFRGWLPFAQVRTAMAQATVLVHPSTGLGDGLPNVVREAMAVGTPVIASDVAGIPDALRDGCGVLVPPRDVQALARAIASTLADPAERMAMAARARARVEERYDLWRNGTRLAQVLQASSRPSGRGPLPLRQPVAAETSPRRFYDLIALDLIVNPPSSTFDPDHLDWSELRQAAERGGALVRVADVLKGITPDADLPPRFGEATAQACRRSQQVVELVDQLSTACTERGVAHAFIRTAESYPDTSRTIDLLVGDPSFAVDREITRAIHAVRRRGALHHRLAGVGSYTLPYGNRLLIRHGRLGRLGEHARLARLVVERARTRRMGTATPLAPTPADHVLILALHQLYTRPEFRLSDLHGAIAALRGPDLDWDYLFATALSTATVPSVGCYLQYLHRVYEAVSGRALVRDEMLNRFMTGLSRTGPALARDARFPRTWSAARLYVQNLRATLESGRWHSAVRLSLMPLVAALTAGTRRSVA